MPNRKVQQKVGRPTRREAGKMRARAAVRRGGPSIGALQQALEFAAANLGPLENQFVGPFPNEETYRATSCQSRSVRAS